jgi:hypothetical protein
MKFFQCNHFAIRQLCSVNITITSCSNTVTSRKEKKKKKKKKEEEISRNPYPHLTCPTYPTSPHHSFFSSRSLFTRNSPPSLSFSVSFSAAHTHILSLPHSHSVTPLSFSPVNHHNHRWNSGRIYRRKPIGDFLGSIYFQYFKVKALCLRFLYFVSFFPNLSSLSVICDLV